MWVGCIVVSDDRVGSNNDRRGDGSIIFRWGEVGKSSPSGRDGGLKKLLFERVNEQRNSSYPVLFYMY